MSPTEAVKFIDFAEYVLVGYSIVVAVLFVNTAWLIMKFNRRKI